MNFEPIARGAALGLATGTACLASCGPVYGAYLLSERRTGMESLRVLLELNAGRFVAYAAFGALFGLLGGVLPAAVRAPLASAGYILFSIYLLLSIARVRRSCGGCAAPKWLKVTRSPLLLGILTGLSICPSFLIAVTGAFGSDGAIPGALLFTGFFAGTTVYMLPFAALGLLTRKAWFTTAARVIALVVAIYFLTTGIRSGVRLLSAGDGIVSPGRTGAGQGEVYSVLEEDTLFVVGFASVPGDHAAELAALLSVHPSPAVVLVEGDADDPHGALARLPRLCSALVPWWVDPRSGSALEPWQEVFSEGLSDGSVRAFAVEYEPWCTDRADAIRGFLERYSFRVDPDSGFTFLMLNTIGCEPEDCVTCPLAGFEN